MTTFNDTLKYLIINNYKKNCQNLTSFIFYCILDLNGKIEHGRDIFKIKIELPQTIVRMLEVIGQFHFGEKIEGCVQNLNIIT